MSLVRAKQNALETIKHWIYETPIASQEIVTVGEYGFAVLLDEEEATLLYETISWQDDESDEEYYICATDCSEIGEFGCIQILTSCDGDGYGLDEGVWLIVSYNQL